MTFLIFDPQNDLIFLNMEPAFEQFLIDSDLISIQSDENSKSITNSVKQSSQHSESTINEDLDPEMALKFSLTLLLAPFISTKRQLDDDANCEMNHLSPQSSFDESLQIHFDSIPNTLIVYKNCHQFIFIHLCEKLSNQSLHGPSTDDPNPLPAIYLQRKISIFAQLTFFVFGNALYNMSKHSRELKLLLELVNKWQELNNDLAFMLECLEHLSLGAHLRQQIHNDMNHVEQLIRLHTQALMNERCTGLLFFFHDKLICNHLSHHTILRQEDVLSIFLLSQLDTPLNDSVTESDEYRNPNYHGNGHLVFLKSHSLSIPVPHIYRKLMITDELYLLTITEVTSPISSILLLSLSTMIESFSSLKSELHDHFRFSPRRWTESLKRIVENFQRFIRRNFEPSLFLSQQLNIGSMTQLTELTKNSQNFESNTLAREQVDRILTLTIRTLYYYYEKLAFNQLHCKLLPQCLQSFTYAQKEITVYLRKIFDSSVDYIRVKYGTERVSLGTLVFQNLDLMAFLLIDRKSNYYTFGHTAELSPNRVCQMICKVYQNFKNIDFEFYHNYAILDDDRLRCIYLNDSLLSKTNKPTMSSTAPGTTCELARILSQDSQTNFLTIPSRASMSSPSPLASSSSSSSVAPVAMAGANYSAQSSQAQYELFVITRIQTISLPSQDVNDNNNSITDSLSLSHLHDATVNIVEPCQPSLKEIVCLAKKVLQFIKNG